MVPLQAPPAEVRPALPAWWQAFLALPRFEAGFRQTSESAVFGSLRKEGRLFLAKGGRLRVAYRQGLLMVGDGQRLVQYDPQARTAQGLSLARALKEFPVLNLLMDPRNLDRTYQVRTEGSRILLKPRQPGVPEVQVEGKGGFPERITWKDATGAAQELLLLDPRQPPAIPDSTFRFEGPKGTRWLGGNPK